MHRAGLFLVMFCIASAVSGQIPIPGGITVPVPLPPVTLAQLFSGFTNSAVDSNGNLLIFDNSFTAPVGVMTSALSSKTHITIVSSDGKTVNGYDYSGAFQLVGVGHDAVYALVTTSGPGGPLQIATITRQLVALRVVAGTLPATLPEVAAPINYDIKLSPGTGAGGTDSIALVSMIALPVVVGATPVAGYSHQVLLFTSDGTKFFPNANNPIATHP